MGLRNEQTSQKQIPYLGKVRYLSYLDTNTGLVKAENLDDPNQLLLIKQQEIPVSAEAPDARASYTLPFGLEPDTMRLSRANSTT